MNDSIKFKKALSDKLTAFCSSDCKGGESASGSGVRALKNFTDRQCLGSMDGTEGGIIFIQGSSMLLGLVEEELDVPGDKLQPEEWS